MKTKDIRDKSDDALRNLVTAKRKELYDFRVGFVGGKTRNGREGGVLRRDVAQILTILNERKRAVGQGGSEIA